MDSLEFAKEMGREFGLKDSVGSGLTYWIDGGDC